MMVGGGGSQPAPVIHEILANRRRRTVIELLQSRPQEAPIEVQELSTHLAAIEMDADPAEITYEDRNSIYVGLCQNHLPKLDDCGLVDYDEESMAVCPTAQTEKASVYMEVVPEGDISWSNVYIGLSVLGSSALIANESAIFPFSSLSFSALAFLILGLVVVAALSHRVSLARRRFELQADVSEVE